MRVVNDREEKTEPSELGVLQVFSYALFCAAGISTVIFCPVPMILAHLRLSDPLAKLSGLLGAVIALTFLEIPLNVVVLTFVYGMFIADAVAKRYSLWKLLAGAALVASIAALAMLSIQAFSEKVSLLVYWRDLVHVSVDQLQKGVQSDGAIKWDQLESLVLHQGPFLYIATALVSLWCSLGIIAHLGWFPELHPFRAETLREQQLPSSVVFLFVALLAGEFAAPVALQSYFSGLIRLVGVLLFVQGSITLSQVMSRKKTKPRARTVVYALSVVFGFYVLVAIGMVSPWIPKWPKLAIPDLTPEAAV